MKTFEFRGYDAAGAPRKGLVEALDLKRARERLAADGILAERLAAAGSRSRMAAFGLSQRTLVYRELVALLRAGMPLAGALDLLIQAPEQSDIRGRLAAVRDAIKDGQSLAAALAGAGRSVTRHEAAVIEAGERTGALDAVLERVADTLEAQAGLRDRLVTALIYPALILTVAVGMAVGLLGFAMPRLGALLAEEAHLELPGLTRFMMSAGRVAVGAGLPLLALAAAGAALGRRAVRRDPERYAAWHGLLLRLPLVGPAFRQLAALRFARTVALLLHGGVPLVDALRLAGDATGNRWLAARMAVEADAVRHGSSLADAVRRVPAFAPLAGWIQMGETGGSLARLLDGAADRLEQRWDRFLARRMSLLEPALILAIGLFVLLIVLAVLLPITALNRQIA